MIKEKQTRQREYIMNILVSEDRPRSSLEIYNSIKEKYSNENIALSTIYRNIILLSQKGQVIKTFASDGTALYTINKHTHTHELECQKCHKKISLDVCPYQFFEESILKDKGFTIIDDNILFKGYCSNCK